MKNKVLCLVMAAFMMMSTSLTVQAEDYQGAEGWTVNFTGNDLETNFEASNMTKDIASLLPGDSITIEIELNTTQEADYYMTNKVIQSLEDNSSANGGAYTYILTFIDKDSTETELYNSDTVGGDNTNQRSANALEGLHQATTNLDDYFYLTRLAENEEAFVRLYVQLDGETQGNDYQNTLASLQMNFAVEKVGAEVITREVTRNMTRNTTRTVGEVVSLGSVVQTGDEAPIGLYSALALASGVALLTVVVKSTQTRRGEKGEQQ